MTLLLMRISTHGRNWSALSQALDSGEEAAIKRALDWGSVALESNVSALSLKLGKSHSFCCCEDLDWWWLITTFMPDRETISAGSVIEWNCTGLISILPSHTCTVKSNDISILSDPNPGRGALFGEFWLGLTMCNQDALQTFTYLNHSYFPNALKFSTASVVFLYRGQGNVHSSRIKIKS